MIYLDSCIVIDDLGGEVVAISPLVMLECLGAPLRDEDLALADHYRRALEQFRLLEIGLAEYLRAAELRARQRLRTPDAVHLATAQLNECGALLTNDSRLATASHGLAVDVTAAA